ncbi:hypothetical protein OS175_09235 [Marinicella sp. S1101]|uniref:hypothetical protein n=1 Tax=Marinicella marina TaxID=2996016 RepID=UPI0024BC7A0F|nr:hypothetical protein [Marinicella marina]MCX7554060.1 hypothetical protein [Marinicella marina]
MPIAKCSKAVEEGYKGEPPTFDIYVYGQELNEESIIPVLSWSLPLIFSVLALRYGNSVFVSLLQVSAGCAAVYSGFWIFIWSKSLLWPAYLALISMAVYCASAAIASFVHIKQWHLTKSSKATPKSGAL